MSKVFAGTSELYCMSAKCRLLTHTKHFIHASKPSYRVSNLAKVTKIKVFLSSCEPHWSKCLVVFHQSTMEIKVS